MRTVLLLAQLMFWWPLVLSAQTSVAFVEPHRTVSAGLEHQVEPLDWLVAPSRFESGAIRQDGTRSFPLGEARSSETTAGPVTLRQATTADWLERTADREVPRPTLSAAATNLAFLLAQQPSALKRRARGRGPSGPRESWIGRHPVLFGTIVGSGCGYVFGHLQGDSADGAFGYDVSAEFIWGVTGALGGALVGALVGR